MVIPLARSGAVPPWRLNTTRARVGTGAADVLSTVRALLPHACATFLVYARAAHWRDIDVASLRHRQTYRNNAGATVHAYRAGAAAPDTARTRIAPRWRLP